jgi:hypothetical protein
MKTLILMADTRDPVNEEVHSAPFYSMASVINLHYAKRHGYDFRFYLIDPLETTEDRRSRVRATHSLDGGLQSRVFSECDVWVIRVLQTISRILKRDRLKRQTRIGLRYVILREFLRPRSEKNVMLQPHDAGAWCKHVRWGERAPAWGKLLALRDGLSLDYDRVIYIDSDAIFATPSISVEAFLAAHRPQRSETPILTVFFNFPWMYIEANSGFMIWENSDRAKQLLETWWNVDAGKYNLCHDWDQHGLNAHLLKDDATGHRQQIAVLPVLSLLEKKGQFIRHVTSPHGWERVPRMRLGLRQNNITADRYTELIKELGSRHFARLDSSVGS